MYAGNVNLVGSEASFDVDGAYVVPDSESASRDVSGSAVAMTGEYDWKWSRVR